MSDKHNVYDPLGPYRKALKAFINTVEATGGCTRDRKGYIVPVAEPEWADLGDAYVCACETLGQEPVIAPSEGDE